jgi:hypothetical protein
MDLMSRLSAPGDNHCAATPSGSALGQALEADGDVGGAELDSADVKRQSGLLGIWSMATTNIRSSASRFLPVRGPVPSGSVF